MSNDIYQLQKLWDQYRVHPSQIKHFDYDHIQNHEQMTSRQIVWHLLNNVDEIPKCPECQKNQLRWKTNKYRQHCSHRCSTSSKEVQEKKKQTCLEKYGVEHAIQSKKVKEKAVQTNLKKYGVEHSSQLEIIRDKRKQTMLERYGVECSAQSEEMNEKRRQTCLERYGVEHGPQSQQAKEKTRQTNLERYGIDYYTRLDSTKEKIKQTMLERHGVEYAAQSKEVQAKRKQTCLERYGVEHTSKSEQMKNASKKTCLERYGVERPIQSEEIRKRHQQTCLEKYGVAHPRQTHYSEEVREILFNKNNFIDFVQDKVFGEVLRQLEISGPTLASYAEKYGVQITRPRSNLEHEMANFLTSLNIKFKGNDKTVIKPLELDFYLPEHNLAIEMNGTHWHSDKHLIETRGMSADEYHQMKTDRCAEQGITLIHISEDEWNKNADLWKQTINTINNTGEKL